MQKNFNLQKRKCKMAETKSVPDSLESYNEDDVDDMISDANRLIASVYSTLFNSSSSSGGGRDSDSQNTSPKTPPARAQESPSSLEVRLEIDRINRLCEVADRNIRATESDLRALPRMIPSPTDGSDEPLNESIRNAPGAPNSPIRTPRRRNRTNASPTPEDVIDLSNSLHTALPSSNYGTVGNDADDDVILVSSSLSNIVDLCTPTRENMSVRRRRNNPPSFSNYRLLTPRRIGSSYLVDLDQPPSRYTASGSTSSATRSRSPRTTTARTRRTLTCAVQTSTTSIRDNTQSQQNKHSNLSSSESSSASSLNAVVSSDSSVNSNSTCNGRTPFMCAVCMESCLNNLPTSTKCGHVFCANCIHQAIRLTRKCPMCNTKLTSRMLFRIYV